MNLYLLFSEKEDYERWIKRQVKKSTDRQSLSPLEANGREKKRIKNFTIEHNYFYQNLQQKHYQSIII